jgi:transposase
MIESNEQLTDIERRLHQMCMEIPYAENILAISGIGENTLCGILAEMGDISRFDDVKEIQKLSGLGLVACSSGKHKGETKISHRGRKRLRYWLFQAAKSAVAHADEFKELHTYYTTRKDNALEAILNAANGTPRMINKLCNASLLVGNSSNLNIITADAVMQAINDCELG